MQTKYKLFVKWLHPNMTKFYTHSAIVLMTLQDAMQQRNRPKRHTQGSNECIVSLAVDL